MERETAIAGFQRTVPPICGQIRKASPHRSTSYSDHQQTRDNILCEAQKIASAGDCAPHTKGISRCMDATRTGTL